MGGTYPLSGFEGDLWSLGSVTVAWGLGDRVLFEIRGDVLQVLSIEERGESAVPLDSGTDDGRTSDAGDFRLSLAFTPLGRTHGFSGGGLVAVRLPNSDESKGIGPNTTDVTLGAVGSWGAERWRATAMAGVAIREAPLESFEQNDLFAYALEWIYSPSARWRLAVSAKGQANTRGRIPLGTGDAGEVRVAVERALGSWRIDAGVSRGFADLTPRWRLSAGIAWTRRGGHRAAGAP